MFPEIFACMQRRSGTKQRNREEKERDLGEERLGIEEGEIGEEK